MFDLQLPLTCIPWTTLSNPCNKVRGKYMCKEVFLRLPSCVFLRASVFIFVSLWCYMNQQMTIQHSDTSMSLAMDLVDLLGLMPLMTWISPINLGVLFWSERSERSFRAAVLPNLFRIIYFIIDTLTLRILRIGTSRNIKTCCFQISRGVKYVIEQPTLQTLPNWLYFAVQETKP